MKQTFSLSNEPIDYQITLHLSNLELAFPETAPMHSPEQINWLLNHPDFIPEYMEMFKVDAFMYRCAHLILHYGHNKMAKHLKEFYSIGEQNVA